MNFAIVYTIIILLPGIPLFITNFTEMIPIGVVGFILRFIPFAAIALLWFYTIFFRLKSRMGVIGIIVCDIYATIFLLNSPYPSANIGLEKKIMY